MLFAAIRLQQETVTLREISQARKKFKINTVVLVPSPPTPRIMLMIHTDPTESFFVASLCSYYL